jgi:hypothetical protein
MGIEGKRSRKAPEEDVDSGLTRRGFVNGVAGAAGLAAALGGTYELNEYLRNHPDAGVQNSESNERSPEVLCNFAEFGLTGKKCTGLAATYFDMKDGEVFPAQKEVNFQNSIEKMWGRKLLETKKVAPQRYAHMQQLAQRQIGNYRKAWNAGEETHGIENFEDFIFKLREQEEKVLTAIDWKGVARKYNITDPWLLEEAQYLSGREQGHAIASYILTEITPSGGSHSSDAIRELAALIELAGVDLILRVPAMGDARPSYGDGQLTDIAVEGNITRRRLLRVPKDSELYERYHATESSSKHHHATREGQINASLNDFLPKHLQVPQSMWDFETFEDHTTGILLLGLDGMVGAVKTLSEQDASDERIYRVVRMSGPTFASVAAAHHYRPAVEEKSLIEWSDDRNWGNDRTPHERFDEICADHDRLVGGYSRRSFDNCTAIDGYFELAKQQGLLTSNR